MPCNSDHMEPHSHEVIASQCLTLIDELNGKKFNKDHYEGYHPDAYNVGITKEGCDSLTAQVCEKLTEIEKRQDISKYSLELQIWWRDHKAADKKREKQEKKNANKESLKKKALAKLTKAERKALGL